MTEQDQIGILTARVEALEVEIATLSRALLSLGSGILAGGEPGPKGYMAWHDHQMNPPPPLEEPAPQVESPSGSTGGLGSSAAQGAQDVNPTSAATQPGSSPTVLPPVSPGSSVPSSPSGSSVPLPNILPSTGAPAGK